MIPSEVELDEHGQQIYSRDEKGNLYERYDECAGGCGFRIGRSSFNADAYEEIWHQSCWDKSIIGKG